MEYHNSMNKVYPAQANIYATHLNHGPTDFTNTDFQGRPQNGISMNSKYSAYPMEAYRMNNNNLYSAGGVWVPMRYVPEYYGYIPFSEEYVNCPTICPIIIPSALNMKNAPFYDHRIEQPQAFTSSMTNMKLKHDQPMEYRYRGKKINEAPMGHKLTHQFFKQYDNRNNWELNEGYETRKICSENLKRKEKLYNSNDEKQRCNSDSASASSTSHTCTKSNKCISSGKSSSKKGGNLPLSLLQRFSKTKMCIHQSEGSCTRGENCPFAHSEDEIRLPPNLYKTRMCELIKEGICPSGHQCKFAHSEAELRSTPEFYKTSICTLFEVGECPHNESCRFAHGAKELRQRSNDKNNYSSHSSNSEYTHSEI